MRFYPASKALSTHKLFWYTINDLESFTQFVFKKTSNSPSLSNFFTLSKEILKCNPRAGFGFNVCLLVFQNFPLSLSCCIVDSPTFNVP